MANKILVAFAVLAVMVYLIIRLAMVYNECIAAGFSKAFCWAVVF